MGTRLSKALKNRNKIDWLILIACQPVGVILCLEVKELHTLYIHIKIFCGVQKIFAYGYMISSIPFKFK